MYKTVGYFNRFSIRFCIYSWRSYMRKIIAIVMIVFLFLVLVGTTFAYDGCSTKGCKVPADFCGPHFHPEEDNDNRPTHLDVGGTVTAMVCSEVKSLR